MPAPIYGYYINLDERGEFYADVRDAAGKTVWELHTQEAQQLLDDGFVRDVRDASQIGRYLTADDSGDLTGVLPARAVVLSSTDFEARQQAVESLYGDHTVSVTAKALVRRNELSWDDRNELNFIQQTHTFIINDLSRLIRDFKPRDEADLVGKGPADRVRFMLEETALDRFHATVAIDVLEDFEITAVASPKAVADGLRVLLDQAPGQAADRDDAPAP